uniref:Hydroxylysine kinase n=1 Tax=Periophthalmus magnuspinnatus TaxID=409849 RepID=A0A3B3ZLY6_9GOBI
MNKAVNPRPEFTSQQAADLTQHLYGLTIHEITSLPSYYDENFCIETTSGSKFVLKIVNSLDSKNRTIMDVQTEAMSFLERCGLPAQTAVHNTSGHLLSFEELDCSHGHQTYCVRLMVYLLGEPITKYLVTQEDLYDRYLSVMGGDPLQDIIREVFETLKSQVLPKLNSFPAGITHGDFSDQNILVTPVGNGHHRVSGVIDFTFLYIKCYVNEVAVTIAYMMLENVCPLSVGGAVLAGWESVMPLSEEERECIYLLVLGRLCQSLVYGQHNALQIPENRDYFLVTAKHGIQILTDLWEMGKKEVEQTWFRDAKTISKCVSQL